MREIPMATKKTKKKATAGKTAKTSKKKRPVTKTKPAAKKKAAPKAKAAPKKPAASKKTGTKAKRKAVKKPQTKKKATVSTLTKAEKAARRRKLNSFRRLLETKRESLLQAYNVSKSNTRIESRDGTEDYIDYAVSSYHRDFTLSLTEMDRKQMKLVEEALARLRRKEYGDCMHCSAVIPQKRLEVEPWARHCITCQELDEQGLLEPPDFEQEQQEPPPAIPEVEPDVGEEPVVEEPEETASEDDDDDED